MKHRSLQEEYIWKLTSPSHSEWLWSNQQSKKWKIASALQNKLVFFSHVGSWCNVVMWHSLPGNLGKWREWYKWRIQNKNSLRRIKLQLVDNKNYWAIERVEWKLHFTCVFLYFFSLLQDYTWENHGFSLVNRLYSDIGHLLDEKFRMVYNLTYNTMATHEDVDTTTLRRALFNYVHCMYGIRYGRKPPG